MVKHLQRSNVWNAFEQKLMLVKAQTPGGLVVGEEAGEEDVDEGVADRRDPAALWKQPVTTRRSADVVALPVATIGLHATSVMNGFIIHA